MAVLGCARFVGVNNEAELEATADSLYQEEKFIAGLVFDYDMIRTKRDVSNATAIPNHITYKIRMDVDNVETTLKLRNM